MALLRVGEIPKPQRGTGRKTGTFRGHEEDAEELRTLAARHPSEGGVVLGKVSASRAQQVASAIKKGTTADFKHDENGYFIAQARKSPDQSGAGTNKDGKALVLYDVWAQYIAGPKPSE